MSNLLSLWSGMDLRKRIIVAVATVGVFAALISIGGAGSRTERALLFAGLDGRNAGAVIQALDAAGTAYEVRGNAIYVDPAQRDQLRLTLAGQGLPETGGAGYELLDGLSGFGTTSQMFDAAYWRAKEGEIARTILANPMVRAARVHIARAPSQPFQPETGTTASVTLTTATGQVPPDTARAIRHLVAAAVAGLSPADVAVIDSVGGLITDPDGAGPGPVGGSDREAELRDRATRLLEARVGPGRAIVQVSAELVTERESISERLFDPKGRVAVSTETEERASSESGADGSVTVASNLPDGDGAEGEGNQSSQTETRERTNFEVSETMREVLRVPGSIRRLSVAVLVDGVTVTAADGTTTIEPRPEEELAILRELVASAVGLDESRGDTLAIRSLAFGALPVEGTEATADGWSIMDRIDVMQLVSVALLALVAIVLGLFVLRPALTGARARTAEDAAALLPTGAVAAIGGPGAEGGALVGQTVDRVADGEILPSLDEGTGAGADDPMDRLRRLIADRQAESVQILRGWLETADEAQR